MPQGKRTGVLIAIAWLLAATGLERVSNAESPFLAPRAYLSQLPADGVNPSSPNYSAYGGYGPTTSSGASLPSASPDSAAGYAGPSPAGQELAVPSDAVEQTMGSPPWSSDGGQSLPRVYFQADVLALRLAEDKTRPMAALDTSTNIVLTTDDVEFDFKAAPRVLLGYVINEEYQMEFTWFDMDHWAERASVRDATVVNNQGDLLSPFSNFGVPQELWDYDNNQVVAIQSSSALENYELSIRHQLPMPPIPLAVSFLWGVRYMDVREGFGYFSESQPGTSNFVVTHTKNDLLGFQIGALFQLGIDPGWWTEFEMKGGIYNNSAGQDTTFYHLGQLAGSGGREADRTAYAGELRWSLVYQYGPHLTTHIGYQAIGLHGLALAYQNMSTNPQVLMLGPDELHHKGGAYYHGPFAGFTVAW